MRLGFLGAGRCRPGGLRSAGPARGRAGAGQGRHGLDVRLEGRASPVQHARRAGVLSPETAPRYFIAYCPGSARKLSRAKVLAAVAVLNSSSCKWAETIG